MFRRASLALVAFAVAASGCAGSSASTSGRDAADPSTTVYAASSLTDVMPLIEADARYEFGSSETLARQLREGAPVDLFVSANTALPDGLHEDGLVERPVVFARNRVVLITPRDSEIRSLDDLVARSDAAVIVAGDGVPVGDYTRKVLSALGQTSVYDQVRSFEKDARSVAAKVALGEGDAGFVYVTDASAVADEVETVELPPTSANRAEYSAAVVVGAPNASAARKLLESLSSDKGRKALSTAGFDLP